MSKEARIEREQIETGIDDYEAKKESWRTLIDSIRERVYRTGNPEDFYTEERSPEDFHFLEEKIFEANRAAEQAFWQRDFDEVIRIGKALLEACGIKEAKNASPASPSHAVALSEAVNWASKTISYEFYGLKPLIIVSTAQIGGVHFGIGEDNAYYLGTESIGMASFHDPNDEIGYLCNSLGLTVPQWEHKWSGVERQSSAFSILSDLSNNTGIAEEYAHATSPEEFREIRQKYLKGAFNQRLTTIGEIIESAKKRLVNKNK